MAQSKDLCILRSTDFNCNHKIPIQIRVSLHTKESAILRRPLSVGNPTTFPGEGDITYYLTHPKAPETPENPFSSQVSVRESVLVSDFCSSPRDSPEPPSLGFWFSSPPTTAQPSPGSHQGFYCCWNVNYPPEAQVSECLLSGCWDCGAFRR